MKKVIGTIDRTGLCLDSDNELIRRSLMARCYTLERKIKRGGMTDVQKMTLQDEYERTFALTEKFGRYSACTNVK